MPTKLKQNYNDFHRDNLNAYVQYAGSVKLQSTSDPSAVCWSYAGRFFLKSKFSVHESQVQFDAVSVKVFVEYIGSIEYAGQLVNGCLQTKRHQSALTTSP